MSIRTNKIHKAYNLLIDMVETGKLEYGFTADDFDEACNCVFQLQKQGFAETDNECVAKFYELQKFEISNNESGFLIVLNGKK